MIPEDLRRLRLRRDDTCAGCGVVLPAGTAASWSPAARRVYCTTCIGGSELALRDAGEAGAAAAREHERRTAKDDAAFSDRWGQLAPIVRGTGLAGAPTQSTRAWARGAAGEQRLAAFLERELGGEAILLHDRRIPGSKANIDHIAIGPSGVWVIDAKRYTGKVERKDVGGWFREDVRVYVGGRDRTNLVKAMPGQIQVVRATLAPATHLADVPVRGSVCFTDSDWGVLNLGKAFEVGGVLVSYPGALRQAILEPRAIDAETIGRVAARLATELDLA